MSIVILEGMFLSAGLRERTWNDKKEVSVQLDLYQPDSPLQNKSVSVKCEDTTILNKIQNEYAMGSVVKVKCMVNAYKNAAYYRLLELLK